MSHGIDTVGGLMSDLSGHTLTHTAMHIDYDGLYAFGCHLLRTGLYIVQTHYVKRDLNESHIARPDFCFYPSFEISVVTHFNKILFQLRFKVYIFGLILV